MPISLHAKVWRRMLTVILHVSIVLTILRRAVAMLLRGDLAYSTGQVINIDGGMEIGRL